MKSNKVLVGMMLGCALLCGAKKSEKQALMVAHDHDVGVGIMLGAPSAFVAKMKLTPTTAVDGGIASYFGAVFWVYSDYIMQFPGLLSGQNQFSKELTPYIGVGGQAIFGSWGNYAGGFGLGVRVPIGIEWRSPKMPLGVFVEVAPSVGIIPALYASFFQGGIGARYYF